MTGSPRFHDLRTGGTLRRWLNAAPTCPGSAQRARHAERSAPATEKPAQTGALTASPRPPSSDAVGATNGGSA